MWEARRTALSALAKLKRTVVLEDATVPRSKIPDMIRALDDISRRFDLTISTFGHAGVGQTAAQPIDELVSLTYHDPRHLEKSLGVAAQPRAVIRMNPRYRLREMVEADRCRGRGGSFNLQHYDVSASIGQRKRDNIVRAGCKVVATGCPACMLHMSDILSRSRDTILVKHTIEIYAESIE
jgi:glycolate oxidase iron-sulfur subunit